MSIIAIFACDKKGGMGCGNKMPWPINKEDLRQFKSLTTNHVVVMGKGTWNSSDMPSPLPDRVNVVVSSSSVDGCDKVISGNVCNEILNLQAEYPDKNIYIIGGANLLSQVTSILSHAIVTKIHKKYKCDVAIDLPQFLSHFKLTSVQPMSAAEVHFFEAIPR